MEYGEILVTAILSSTVVGIVVSAVLARRTETIKRDVEAQFARMQTVLQSRRTWKEQAVAELLGPVNIQLDRTERAFDRWSAQNLYLEAKVIREGNKAVRDLLLQQPHLLPPTLLVRAGELIEHYDRWLEEFDRLRKADEPDLDKPFVFVGPAGYPFPRTAEQAFRETYKAMWQELYGAHDG